MISLFNLIKRAATNTHKIEQDKKIVFEDFSEEFEKQLNKAKFAQEAEAPQEIPEDVEIPGTELDEYDLEALIQQKKKLLQEIKELEQKSEDMVANAKNAAKDIEIEAKKKGKAEGYEKGYSEGSEKGYKDSVEEGIRQIKSDNETLLAELQQLIQSTEIKKDEILKKYQEDLKDIAIAVAEKVVHVSLKSSGDIIKRMILAATEGMTDLKWAKIYIAESDSEIMVRGDKNLIGELSQLSGNIKVIVMPDEEPGTCIIELPNKIIDASARTQIENIRDIISSARR